MDLIDRLAEHKTLGAAPRHKTLGAAPREELAWLAEHGTLRHLEAGEVLSHKGVQVEGLYVVLSGHVTLSVDRGSGPQKIIEWRTGEVSGILPYSRLTTPPGDAVAQEPTEILSLPRELLRALTHDCFVITSILVHTMLDRARLFTSSDLLNEKMISLGKLSAGLAHELNNPASAIERSAALLEDRLGEAETATLALGVARLSDAQLAAVDAIRNTCLARAPDGIRSPVQQAEREEAIADWLADHGLDAAGAEALADTPVTIESLDQLASAVQGPALDVVLRWAAAGCAVRSLASEIQEAAMRISGLVTAIKGFTHMDQAMVADPVDLGQSLANTVAVLRAKARQKSAAVAIELEASLPFVRGFAGELNQIWGNLIDNALDAVEDGGHVEVKASREGERVVVRIIDDGPGIPAPIRERIFDPFFTTKPMGQGTGLGLDIVRRLLRHNDATIEVDSRPGRTEFRVAMPIDETQNTGPAR
ncbi:putative Two-component sensor histidine kinase [Candidatus Sulfotelmatomonas gaucii]|uniref:histidine kinase n=1 Tax=Candidatus Sulfuritelmatomonas gaucii TaxID=2043161 RepID=A0A2N9L489_9BACT|nr:putative Two-component sensor histidine kinase [Candidatus Sulfotelmatomonas gaucii]